MAIDVGRSIRIARAQSGLSNPEIAERTGFHVKRVSFLANSPTASISTIHRFASLFGMTASAFIALGEQDDNSAG